MWYYLAALVAILAGSRAQQEVGKKQEQPATVQQPAPLSYYGGFQGQLPLQYDVRFLEPQVQIQNLGFGSEKQIYPRWVLRIPVQNQLFKAIKISTCSDNSEE